jgi:hypothetical protein
MSGYAMRNESLSTNMCEITPEVFILSLTTQIFVNSLFYNDKSIKKNKFNLFLFIVQVFPLLI